MLFRAEKGNIEDFLRDYLSEYDKTRGKGYISIPTGNHDLPTISYERTKKELEVAYAFIMTMQGVSFAVPQLLCRMTA